jgi:hypothetical protein
MDFYFGRNITFNYVAMTFILSTTQHNIQQKNAACVEMIQQIRKNVHKFSLFFPTFPGPRMVANKKVSWIRHRYVYIYIFASFSTFFFFKHNLSHDPFPLIRDLHILTVGTYTYTTDQRFTTTHHKETDEWTLQIKFAQKRDAGL